MAWVGVVAILGLIVCVVAELRELRIRRKERALPDGEVYTPKWSGARLGLIGGGALASLVGIGFVISALIGGGASSTLKVAPTSSTSSTTTPPIIASTTTTAPLGPARAPQLVRVDVLNASAVPRAATLKAQGLAAAGYRIAFTGNAVTQPGTVVECKAGFAAEAVALARVVGPGTLVQGFPTPPPLGSTNADCVVLLGQ